VDFLCGSRYRKIQRPLGGLLALCGWLPFAQNIEGMLCEPIFDGPCTPQALRLVSGFFFDEITAQGLPQTDQTVDSSVLSTPVLLSHGTDDVWVSVDLGRQASRIIQRVMTHVECHEFTGAASDGHWSKNLKVLTRFFNSFKNDLPPPVKRLNRSMVNARGYANSYTQALVKGYVH
jgi:pimeloyl-ACP methyl ester carboxylesterase